MIADRMRARLAALDPTRLEVIDESARHAGHAGARPEGESHFRVRMAAPAFAGLTRLQRHRLVHATLGDLVPAIHALALELEVPAQRALDAGGTGE